jgi:cytochrome b involved in lipid metabolism
MLINGRAKKVLFSARMLSNLTGASARRPCANGKANGTNTAVLPGMLGVLALSYAVYNEDAIPTKCHGESSISRRRQELRNFLQSPSTNSLAVVAIEDLPEYSSEEVSQRNGVGSNPIWMSYGGFVYDVTGFIPIHPGGTERILRAAGAPIEPFWYMHQQHFDTEEPARILKRLVVGRLVEADQSDIDSRLEKLQEELEAFQLEIDSSGFGNNASPSRLCLMDLKALPKTDVKSQVGCPQNQDRRPVSISIFGGVRMEDLLVTLDLDGSVGRLVFHAMDGDEYSVDVGDEYKDILVCYEMDGAPLTKSRGFPLRIIWKSTQAHRRTPNRHKIAGYSP